MGKYQHSKHETGDNSILRKLSVRPFCRGGANNSPRTVVITHNATAILRSNTAGVFFFFFFFFFILFP